MSPIPWNDRPAAVPMPKAPAAFGLSRSAIYRAAAEGKIILRKLGASTLVDTESALAFLASLPVAEVKADARRKAA